jgi:hypothetical protein
MRAIPRLSRNTRYLLSVRVLLHRSGRA